MFGQLKKSDVNSAVVTAGKSIVEEKLLYSIPEIIVWNSKELIRGAANEILESNSGYYNS